MISKEKRMRFRSDEDLLMEMANLRGKDVKIEDINFSIYFSPKQTDQHSIRIKVLWNRERMNSGNFDGVLYLHGDYEYKQNPNADNKPDMYDIFELRYFAKRYKVLFDTGKIKGDVYNTTCQDYAWAVGQAQTSLIMPTIDELESITNSWNTLIPRVTEHRTGFINNGSKEILKQQ